jgi:ATP-binding cassette, subfamily B, bacterial
MIELYQKVEVSVRSSGPGRVRWRILACLDRPDIAARIEALLRTRTGVRSVSANPVTGSLLLIYEARFGVEPFQLFLEQISLASIESDAPSNSSEIAVSKPKYKASMQQITELTRGYYKSAASLLLISIVDRLFEAAPSAMIGAAGDIVTRRSGSVFGKLGFKTVRSQLFALGGVSAVIWALDSIMSYWHTRASGKLAREIQNDLRNKAYKQLQTLDIAQLEGRPVSEWIGLVRSDTGRIAHFIEEGVDPFVTMFTNGLTVAATFLLRSPALAAIQMAVLPVLYLVSTKLLAPIRERQEIARDREDDLDAAVLNNVNGISTITNFGRQGAEADRIALLGSAYIESADHTASIAAAYVPSIQMVVAGGFVSTLVWGGNLVDAGRLSNTFYNVMGFACLRLFNALARLGISIEHFQRTRVSFDRLIQLLEMRPLIRSGDVPLHASSVSGDIVFQDVTFRYVPERAALNKVNLHIAAGKTTAIVGPTGAGKTTLQKLLLRFYEHESGSVLLDGEDIRHLDTFDLRNAIATVPQQTFLFDGTVRENIAYSRPEASLEEVVSAAQAAQCDDFIRGLTDGYETQVGENGNKLSGGQKQRLAIARAVLAARPIMFFDEATSAIDYETEAAMQKSMGSVVANRTTLVIAHRLSTVRDADMIYVMQDGAVCEQGTHDELLSADGLYAGMWRIQTGEANRHAAASKTD